MSSNIIVCQGSLSTSRFQTVIFLIPALLQNNYNNLTTFSMWYRTIYYEFNSDDAELVLVDFSLLHDIRFSTY